MRRISIRSFVKNVILLVILGVMIHISGCRHTESYLEQDMADQQEGVSTFYSHEMIIPEETEFLEIINGNPIDKTWIWKDTGSEERISLAVKYRDLWMTEIENTQTILKEYLSDQESDMLDHSYVCWKEYISDMTCLEQDIFYPGTLAGSNLTYPKVMEVCANRTREYAIELMSLEYALTGNVEFVYQE